MNNYEFCTQWVLDQNPSANPRVLDYGCGSGQIVKKMRDMNIEAYGCDVFYEAGTYLKSVDPEFLDKGFIKRMVGNKIPFDDSFFDFVLSNQVMEHVENLDGVLQEIDRVLKPGGRVLSLFPDKSVWREGHCGIPFLHWFPKYSTPRIYYAAGLRLVGMGSHKGNKSILRWSRDKCKYLDKWTHYRSQKEIVESFSQYFNPIENIEDYWLQQRLGGKKFMIAWAPSAIQKLIVNKLSGMVFVASKKRKKRGQSPFFA